MLLPLPSVSRLPLALALALSVLLPACGDESVGFDAQAFDVPEMDAVIDRPGPPRDVSTDLLGRVCTRSAQCDDGVACTTDVCASDGRCINLPNHMQCDDTVYCNGLELCDVRRGCVRGTPVSCNDNFTCTVDRCDEPTKSCVHSPRDFDHDGDPDGRCHAAECGDAGVPEPDAGVPTPCWRGGDCDDLNPRVNSLSPEICGDSVDNNCNGQTDGMEPGGCRLPPHDRCDDALDVSAGGRFRVGLGGTSGDYNITCAGGRPLARDAVLRFRLDAPRDVAITAGSSSSAIYLAFQRACGSTTSADTLECTLGYPSTYRQHSLPSGEYWVILGAASASTTGTDVDVTVTFSPATPSPMNDRCTAATVIPPTGGEFRGDLIGVTGDVLTRCGGTQPDVLYSLTLTETRDVTLRLTAGRSEYMTLALVDRCVASPTTLRCDTGAPAQFTAHQLAPGTYFVVVAGRNVADFTLSATVGPPTPALAGDTCDAPMEISSGMTVMGTLSNLESDYNISCAGGSSRDAVYRFTLTERNDVTVTARNGASDYFYLAVQTTCGGSTTAERGCRFGAPARLTARGLDPGTYYLIVKGLRPTDYQLSLTTSPPLTPMTVTGNDTCATGAPVPSGGGLYTGTTTSLRADYACPCSPSSRSEDAVFRYHADVRQRVAFSLEGSSFDTVMWLTRGDACPGTNVAGACNDDSIGTASAFDVVLDPGDYYLFVGGFGTTSRGPYTLSVTTSAP